MQVARTPDERFEALPNFPFEPHYAEIDDGEGGRLRVHYVDEGHEMGLQCYSFTENHRGASSIATSSRNLSMEDVV